MTMCVTGYMAAGKNFVCTIFESLGWETIDADKVVHDAVKKLTPQILDAFSCEAKQANITLTNEDSSLNRRALGKLIFGKPELLARQENIVYPEVIFQIKKFCKTQNLPADNTTIIESASPNASTSRSKNAIINATVLYKTPELMNICDTIIFVTAPFFTRLHRAVQRDKIPVQSIIARFKTQQNLLQEYKTAARQLNIPFHLVKNYGSAKALEDKIKKLNTSLL